VVYFDLRGCIFNMFWGDGVLKKLMIFLLFLSVFNINALTSFVQGANLGVDTSIKVYDYADLFSDSEEASLSDQANDILERQNIDIAIVTTDDVGRKSSIQYADDFYDYNDFGYGSRKSGLLLLINMQDREVWISTAGEAMGLFNNSSIVRIIDEMYDYLDDDDYYSAGVRFLSSADEHISSERVKQLPFKEKYSKGRMALFSAGIALVVSSITIGIMYFLHRLSFSPVPNANIYSKDGGFKLFRRNDQFINTHTSRTPIPKERDSGGSGGGTSIHRSSSGTSHGGGGRKF